MNLTAMQMEKNRKELKMTVLHREGEVWHQEEVRRLAHNLQTEVSGHLEHSEYLILFGHYTKEQLLGAIGGGLAFTAVSTTGVKNNRELPFCPGFV